MVWIVEWTQHGQCETKVSLWSSRGEAEAAACAVIMQVIMSEWDLGDSTCNDHALIISDECAAMNFKAAIDLYNDWEADGDAEYMQHFSVYERTVGQVVPTIRLLKPQGTTTVPAPPSAPPPPFKATVVGATCRGPCGQRNDYAYADKFDGTYCCYQCKYMTQVFGGKTP